MVNIYDVARLAGVSTATVSRYVNGTSNPRPDTADRIERAIRETGYVPSHAARTLVTKSTGLIGFLTSDLLNPFTSELAQSMAEHAGRSGLSLLTAVTFGQPERFVELVRELRRHQVDGIIATPPESPEVVRALTEASQAGARVATIGITLPDGAGDFVSCDTYGGGLLAMEHLLDLGHRRIGFITGEPATSVAGSRFLAYRDSLMRTDIPFEQDLIKEGTLDREGGFAATLELLDRSDRPTAIFAVNDLIALGAIQAAASRQIRVPDDLSIVGFDDIPMASHSTPALTTVAQPRSELGRLAAEFLITRLQDKQAAPQSVRLDCSLVERASTTQPPQAG